MLINWAQIGGAWYYFGTSGVMATGWAQIGGSWYYFGSSGVMSTGWVHTGGNRYRFNGSGRWVSIYSGTYTCPSSHPIKGNRDSMIYHRPGQQSYNVTKAEECFAYASDAEAAGYRAAKR